MLPFIEGLANGKTRNLKPETRNAKRRLLTFAA